MGLVITLFEVLAFVYTVLKTSSSYSRSKLILLITMFNYSILGIMTTIYFLCLYGVITYDYCFPAINHAIYQKIKNNKRIKLLIEFNNYKVIQDIKHVIIRSGDFVCSLCYLMWQSLLTRLHINTTQPKKISHPLIPTQVNDDYIKLGSELDRLLKYGTGIIAESAIGNKETQRQNATLFINEVNKLFADESKKDKKDK